MNTYWVQNKDLEIEFKKRVHLRFAFGNQMSLTW